MAQDLEASILTLLCIGRIIKHTLSQNWQPNSWLKPPPLPPPNELTQQAVTYIPSLEDLHLCSVSEQENTVVHPPQDTSRCMSNHIVPSVHVSLFSMLQIKAEIIILQWGHPVVILLRCTISVTKQNLVFPAESLCLWLWICRYRFQPWQRGFIWHKEQPCRLNTADGYLCLCTLVACLRSAPYNAAQGSMSFCISNTCPV